MFLKFHGATKEVGRSCVELAFSSNPSSAQNISYAGNKTRFLLDCGIKLTANSLEYPTKIENPQEINAIFVSHAHLDHTGYLPHLIHEGFNAPIYCTETTKETTRMLLEDAHKIEAAEHRHPGYETRDIEEVMQLTRPVNYRQEITAGNARCMFYDAGHIPGSSSILLNIAGKKILYTGDIKLEETRLIKGADTNYKENPDILIIESTYGSREHDSRAETEKKFLEQTNKTLNNGGSVIIPVFAVGRAQEILLLLSKEAKELNAPVYFEGMSKRVTQSYLARPSGLKSAEELRQAMKKVHFLKDEKDRANAVERQGVFISTAGMLSGGPVLNYIKHLGRDRKNSILLTGYQGEGTNGRSLINKGFVTIDNKIMDVKSKVFQYDFSAHAGASELKSLIQKTKPRITIINHGDFEEAESLADYARQFCKVYVPELDEEINVE